MTACETTPQRGALVLGISTTMDPAPFDSPDADVTLRTDDGTSFRVYSRILSEASPFFRDLFTLPQPAADKDASTAVVPVCEGSEIIHTLLRFTYPIEDPPVETLSLLSDVLGAALKYDLAVAVQSLQRLLLSPKFVENEPTRVYAIACRHGLEEEAKIASSHTLNVNVLDGPIVEELKFITAYDYHRLLALHRSRSTAAQNYLLMCYTDTRCSQCSDGEFGLTKPSRWWVDWTTRAKEEVRRKPTTNVIFSLAFLAKSSKAGCERCAASMLKSHESLLALKKRIDGLPVTI
jgi:BTB/POZ domain